MTVIIWNWRTVCRVTRNINSFNLSLKKIMGRPWATKSFLRRQLARYWFDKCLRDPALIFYIIRKRKYNIMAINRYVYTHVHRCAHIYETHLTDCALYLAYLPICIIYACDDAHTVISSLLYYYYNALKCC